MDNRPPEITATSRLFLTLVRATDHWSGRRCWLVSVAGFAVLELVDYLTGAYISLLFPYMICAAIAVWCVGERGGVVLAACAVVISALIRHHALMADPNGIAIGPLTEIWNCITRLLSITLLASLVAGLRAALELERWRASCDGLTGVLNKLAFDERMAITLHRARDGGQAVLFAYMDLDGFKGVNDRYGHAAGDGVLRSFATAASQAIRSTDLFARIGGDEFVVLMAIPSCGDGDQMAAMLHSRLTAILMATGYDVTCSMGALVIDARELSSGVSLIELADSLMYEVKRSGKNAFRTARPGGVVPFGERESIQRPHQAMAV